MCVWDRVVTKHRNGAGCMWNTKENETGRKERERERKEVRRDLKKKGTNNRVGNKEKRKKSF